MGVIAVLWHWHLLERLGSVGRPAYNVDLACAHSDGTLIKSGEISEIISRSKRPQRVKFVDDFPKMPIGKIQKNFLKDPYWAEQEKKYDQRLWRLRTAEV